MQLLYLSFFIAFVSPLALAQSQTQKVCTGLHKYLSNSSSLYYPGTADYDAGVTHWTNSSSQSATCVVEPGSAEDVAEILRTVGRTRTPFAIKGGGHSTNQGFSSTTGVQIAMSRFRQIEYDAKLQSVVVGAGLVWDEVYAALDPLNVTVVGGRVVGIGVAGLTLGGGYSYLTNMYGLASDNVLEYELVLPTGSIVHVNAASHPDLFFGLRGGFNNLGIVTKFTLKTYPLGPVWGGVVFVSPEYATDVFAATAKFQSTNKDPKAAMILTLNSAVLPDAGPTPVQLLSYNLFYAAPDPAPGVFDDFISIPTIEVEGSEQSFGTTTLTSIVLAAKPGTYSRSPRALSHTYGFTDYSMEFLSAVWNETIAEGQNLVKDSLMLISVAIEPFLDSALSHSSTPSLYPAHREKVFLPTALTMSWSDPTMDVIMHTAARDIIKNLETTASTLGQDLSRAVLYSNYALVGQGTTVEQFWGRDHVRRLGALRRSYDPYNVMSLTGGWKV